MKTFVIIAALGVIMALLLGSQMNATQRVVWLNKHACEVYERPGNISLNCGLVAVSIDLRQGRVVDSNVYVKQSPAPIRVEDHPNSI